MTDSKMPERIWAVGASGGGCVVSFDTPSLDYKHEYIRADIAHTAPVADAELIREIERIMADYDANPPPDDESGMAASINLGPEYFRKIVTTLRARTAQPVRVSAVQDAAKVLLDSLSLRTIGQDHPQITPEMTIAASMFLSALLPEGGA